MLLSRFSRFRVQFVCNPCGNNGNNGQFFLRFVYCVDTIDAVDTMDSSAPVCGTGCCGFEPSADSDDCSGFRDCPVRPLRHLSV